jgi:hypothetical protein
MPDAGMIKKAEGNRNNQITNAARMPVQQKRQEKITPAASKNT